MNTRTMRSFLFGTLRGRLILGVATVHAAMMTLFIIDVTMRQRAMFQARQEEAATSLAQSLATTGSAWLASADIAGLQELVDAQRRYPELIFATLTDPAGHILAHTDVSRRGQYLLDLPVVKQMMVVRKSTELVDVVVPAFVGGRHVGWARVGIGRIAATRKLIEITRDGTLYGIMAIVFGTGFAWLMGRVITRRLYTVQETISEVRKGNRAARSRLAGPDEAASIAREFNIMLDALATQESAIIQSERQYRTLLQNIQAAVVVHGPDTRVQMCNSMAQELLGLSEEQVLGKTAMDPAWHFFSEAGVTLPLDDYPINHVLRTRSAMRNCTIGVHRPHNDQDVWALVNADPVFDQTGEIIQVVVTFIDITARVKTEAAMKEQYSTLRSIIDSGNSSIFSVDRLYRYTNFNTTHAAIMKAIYGKEIETGHNLLEYMTVREDRETAKRNIDRVLAGGGRIVEEAYSGEELLSRQYFQVSHSPIMTDDHEVIGVAVLSQDITERKRAEEEVHTLNRELEQRVTDRTAQLEAANKELEAFAYSVSHDLRAPLRGIDGFSQVLLEEYEEKLDEQGREYLHRVRTAAQRMALLIDDLLTLSRLSRSEMEIQPVNLSKIAREIAAELRESQPLRQAEFVIQDRIVVRGDARLLRVVLQNLLGNAWKFTSTHTTARIEYGMLQQEQPVYFVRDDGAGFDMKYATKLFAAFQRLHSASEFAGTGIGLATVQRIIHRHGGTVWAEGEIERGATFFFTLPQG
ncbi:MAG TPA: PAS domain S-box protein [Bacteroidota bacterium]|nr:PAS domain S-box protein [Bacteroidota bacterium]